MQANIFKGKHHIKEHAKAETARVHGFKYQALLKAKSAAMTRDRARAKAPGLPRAFCDFNPIQTITPAPAGYVLKGHVINQVRFLHDAGGACARPHDVLLRRFVAWLTDAVQRSKVAATQSQ